MDTDTVTFHSKMKSVEPQSESPTLPEYKLPVLHRHESDRRLAEKKEVLKEYCHRCMKSAQRYHIRWSEQKTKDDKLNLSRNTLVVFGTVLVSAKTAGVPYCDYIAIIILLLSMLINAWSTTLLLQDKCQKDNLASIQLTSLANEMHAVLLQNELTGEDVVDKIKQLVSKKTLIEQSATPLDFEPERLPKYTPPAQTRDREMEEV
jgi:hypothetical protein